MPPVALHVNVALMGLPFWSLAVAVNWTVPPVEVLAGLGVTVIEVSVCCVGCVTFTVALPDTEPLVAVTENVPAVEPAV